MAKDRIRILLVDDQTMFRDGMRVLLSSQKDFEIVGEAADGEEAVQKSAALQPDVVLMDLRMPILDGAAATRRLRTAQPGCRVIVLTTFDEDEAIFEGLRSGAIGYLLKDAPTDKLYEAIRAAARGESFLQPSVAARVVAEFARLAERSPAWTQGMEEPLTERELEVLRLLATGATNREIARQLVLAEGTVKNHVTGILTKLGVSDRTRAALKARELGIF
ncbi:MAG TPA: response regulator transcription factor [Anaerolineaceae bacterium]|nr:response regulator transcription factor [Anaerolineaceae bacterium]